MFTCQRVALLVLLVSAIVRGADAPVGDPPAAKTLTIDTTGRPLETVLRWISSRTGVNVVCTEEGAPPAHLHIFNATLQEVVDQIAAQYGFVVEKKSDLNWVLTRPQPGNRPATEQLPTPNGEVVSPPIPAGTSPTKTEHEATALALRDDVFPAIPYPPTQPQE